MNKYIKYLIYIPIFLIFFAIQYQSNENIRLNLVASSNSISLYDSVSLYDMTDYVETVQNDENIDSVNGYLDSKVETLGQDNVENINVNLINSNSLLNLNTTKSDVTDVNAYIDENVDFLVAGYTLQIDGKSYYSKSMDDIEWLKQEIYKKITPNVQVAQDLIEDGEIAPYDDGDREVIKIELDNKINVTQGNVPAESVSDTKEDLLYDILHDKEEIKYDTIDEGETINDVAASNGISTDTLIYNNRGIGNDILLYDGQELVVNDIGTAINVAYYYEETTEEEVEYSTEIITDDSMDAGETITEVEGEKGLQQVTYETKEVNGVPQYSNVADSVVVEKPVTEVLRVGTHQVDGGGTGDFMWPSNGKKVICDYYCYSGHGGIDIRDYYGAPVFASDNGTVTEAECSGAYGCHVFINHNNGYETRYAHMKTTPSVTAGNNVSQGQVIGYEGATGNVTAEHLHFEVRYNGVANDPLTYF